MKYILIILISIFSLNYSFCQMKVYAGTTEYNSHLVGKIYSSGKVYKYKNGKEVLWGIVRDDIFFFYGENNSEIRAASYNDVPTMGGGGKIYIDVAEGYDREMIGFMNGANYYYGVDIEDESIMTGYHVNGFLYGLDGSYAAAYYLIINNGK